MYLKRLLAFLCCFTLVFCLFPSSAFATGGNGNIDGGGGSMGHGTSSNFWNSGNDGVRITVVDASSGTAVSSPLDFSNRTQKTNITSAINSLKMKIPNRVFHEWCGTLIQCQSDRSMKNTLPTINQKFSDVRVVQSELEAMMQGPRREAITMIFLVIANVPLLYFLNEDWFHTLIFTTPGKIALAICAAIILFALTQIMKLSKPIEYGGDSV